MDCQQRTLVIAPDSFKGALSASEVATVLGRGVQRIVGDTVRVIVTPLADGGEGTSDIALALGGIKEPSPTVNIYGEPQDNGFWVRWGSRAIVEAAVGSGFIPESRRQFPASRTTSLGTGLLIQSAMADPDIQEVLVALGGSGSTDGGLGLLAGIGGRFWNAGGSELKPFGDHLAQVADYEVPAPPKPLIGLYDVGVPLLGERGSVALFGPQKGLNWEDLPEIERGMENWADVVNRKTSGALAWIAGSGAAGGMGFGILVARGSLQPGAQAVAEWQGLQAQIEGSDWVVTGEGRMDAQTEEGKVAAVVIQQAHAAHKPVIAVVGSRARDLTRLHQRGLTLVLPILTEPMSLHNAIDNTAELLETAGEEIGWVISEWEPR